MAATELVYFQETDGSVPLIEWFDTLPIKVIQKWEAKLGRLEQLGHSKLRFRFTAR